MTREEAINKWVMPAIKNTWNEKKCEEIIKALEKEPCEDAISRKDLLSKAWFVTGDDFPMEGLEYITKGMVKDMPPVIPKQKTGHWIVISPTDMCCSECHEMEHLDTSRKFCGYCGARMKESK